MTDLKNLIVTYPQAKIVVSGFSLGAAMANIALFDICKTLGKVDLFITFGAPRVGNKKFAESMKKLNCGGIEKIRVVNNRDPVAHYPMEAMGFRHGQSEIFYKNGNYTFCENEESGECSGKIKWTKLIKIEMEDHFDYLGDVQRKTKYKKFDILETKKKNKEEL